jgi:hypothetical protein
LDGETWTEVDRHDLDRNSRQACPAVSVALSNPVECRFIRMELTHERLVRRLVYCAGVFIPSTAVEFFGTLCISQQANKSPSELELPMIRQGPEEGIIGYLTERHGGHVCSLDLVTLTSKSENRSAFNPANLASLHPRGRFWSSNEPGQWVCWDFHHMRVCPTHYGIRCWRLKSWVLEGSLDGENWREMDRQTDTQDFKVHTTKVFAVSVPMKCQFIRLTQMDKDHYGYDYLELSDVEFFGALSE